MLIMNLMMVILDLHNIGQDVYSVKKGDKIGQLFFFKFLTVDDEVAPTEVRKGGFGSTVK